MDEKMKYIADEHILYHSPNSEGLYCYTPWICHGFNGRLLASFDIAGPFLKEMPGPKSDHGDYGSNQCRIYRSDDHGKTWIHCADLPMLHARIFAAGKCLYLLGHSGRLLIAKSQDNGETWSPVSVLDPECRWHQSGGSIDFHNGKVYLSMEKTPYTDHWHGGDPILMSADVEHDLMQRESWHFSNIIRFDDCAKFANTSPIDFFGNCWLESSVVRIYDPRHRFFDPSGRSVLVFLRVDGCEHYAAVLRGLENPDGSLSLETLKREDSSSLIFFPFPGGHMKFHIVYDEKERLYWMVASHTEYSAGFSAPPFRERRALGLYCSKTLFDWQLAGIVSAGEKTICSRHYASLVIDGDDILIACRSGDQSAKNTHDTNMITIHKVRNFRNYALKGVQE